MYKLGLCCIHNKNKGFSPLEVLFNICTCLARMKILCPTAFGEASLSSSSSSIASSDWNALFAAST